METRTGSSIAGRALVAMGILAGLVFSAEAKAAAACSGASCGACAPPAGFAISTLLDSSNLPVGGANSFIAFVDPKDGSARRFAATQEGMIWVWSGPQATPFLNLTARAQFPGGSGESGLLSMTVSPNYAVDGEFYVYYTGEGAAPGDDGDIVIERYTRSANPNVANTTPTSILVIDHPSSNHNGGTLAFGPDGYLYVTVGDGGGSCDSSSGGPNAQNINELLGKILRLDVDGVDPGATGPECESNQGYLIPTGNPYRFPAAGCGEIWAVGLRNPFRMSIDGETGDIFYGDVGQGTWEEIDFLRAGIAPPLNFGWKCREGCQTSTCTNSGSDLCPDTLVAGVSACQYGFDADPDVGSFFIYDPILCHTHSSFQSIMGGYMYRGEQVPALSDRYFYSDYFCGQIWATNSFDRMSPAATTSSCLEDTGGGITGFAVDHLGEAYIVRGGDGRIDCIHDGNPRGCYWANAGLFSDGFESNDTHRWSSVVP